MSKDRCILGTVSIGGCFGKGRPAGICRYLLAALEAGIGAIDTSPAYEMLNCMSAKRLVFGKV